MDIWDNSNSNSPGRYLIHNKIFICLFYIIYCLLATRSGVIGMSSIGGVCSADKYSVVEYAGLNSIQNAAHELGHK